MFTGLIEEVGTVRSINRSRDYMRLWIDCATILPGLEAGDSISVEGACQTAVEHDARGFAVDTLAETLRKTTFSTFGVGVPVNLERALRVSDRLGGHIVQGHVDGTGTIEAIDKNERNTYLTIALEPELLCFCISEGSISIDGVSLTIAALLSNGIRINVIPETWERTSLRHRRPGQPVNIEVDVLARYVAKLLGNSRNTLTDTGSLQSEQLLQWGYGG